MIDLVPQTSGPVKNIVLDQIFEPLLRLSPSFELADNVVSDWTIDPDGRKISLTISDRYYFHNGRKLEPKDVVFGLYLGFVQKKHKINGSPLQAIDCADYWKKLERSDQEFLACPAVSISKSNIISIQLKERSPGFLLSLTHTLSAPLPREALDVPSLNWRLAPVGSGPFKFESKVKTTVILSRFSKHFSTNLGNSRDQLFFDADNEPNNFDISLDYQQELKDNSNWNQITTPEGGLLTSKFVFGSSTVGDEALRARKSLLFLSRQIVKENLKNLSRVDPYDCFVPPQFWPKCSVLKDQFKDDDILKSMIYLRAKKVIFYVRKGISQNHISKVFVKSISDKLALKYKVTIAIIEVDPSGPFDFDSNTFASYISVSTFPLPDPSMLSFHLRSPQSHFLKIPFPELDQILDSGATAQDRNVREREYQKALNFLDTNSVAGALGYVPIVVSYRPKKLDLSKAFSIWSKLRFDHVVLRGVEQ